MKDRLVIFAKSPIPGKVKTRLVPPHSYEEAAALYRDWAKDIYRRAKTLDVPIQIAYEASPEYPIPSWLADGMEPVDFFPQGPGGLGERLAQAFDRSFKDGCRRVVAIGSDSPGLPLERIREAFAALESRPVALGPAMDGGYYLVGLNAPFPQLFENIAWSTSAVFSQTLRAAEAAGRACHVLEEYFDIDGPRELREYQKFGSVRSRPLKKISVIIPVKNEEAVLGACIERLKEPSPERQAGTPPSIETEVIVVDGQSSDRTVEIARALADAVYVSPRPGRAAQMHLGAEKSAGDALLFLHADTALPPGWREILRRDFWEDENLPAAAAFSLSFDSHRWPYRAIELLASVRNAATGVPQGDQGLAVRRGAYFQAGGYPPVPLMEEYHFLPRLRALGGVKILREKIVTSARRYEARGPFRNALRNGLIVLLHYLRVRPERLAELYRPAAPSARQRTD